MPLNPARLQSRIDTLLFADDFALSRWEPAFQTKPLTMTYRFETEPARDFYWNDVSAPVSYAESHKAAVRRALGKFEDVLNVVFVEDNSSKDAMISFYRSPDLFTESPLFGGGRADFEFVSPTKGGATRFDWDGAVVFVEAFDLGSDTYFDLILHEIGHALGLKHPGNYDIPGVVTDRLPFLPADEDNFKLTMMSYNSNPDTKAKPAELMLYDVAALQQWWGQNDSAYAGRTVHQPFSDGDLKVIWDAGGVDKIEQDGSDPVKIDLRQGAFSSENGKDKVAIAFGTIIENARGSVGSDRLIGNETGNKLSGFWGSDTLIGGAGEDTMWGGRGADRLFGGAGRDTLYGGPGRDQIKGGANNDRLTGGAGNDTFVFTGGFGDDVLVDFNADNNRERIDLSGVASITDFADLTKAGNPHMTQAGADVVIDDFAGNSITILNVSLGDMNSKDFMF